MSTSTVTHPAGPPATGTNGVAAIRAVGLHKVFGTGASAVVAIDDLDLEITAGQFTAIMGPSGSGKSTLMHVLAGLDMADAGTVSLGDQDLTRLSDTELTRVRRDEIGFVFQAFNLLPTLTAAENIALPAMLAGRTLDQAWLERVVDAVGLRPRLTHRPTELSGGQQQRVAVARALAGRPRVIFADEPTGNLDSRAGAEVLALLRRSVDEFGQTVVMVTHDPVAAAHADRVLFLADGHLDAELVTPSAADVLRELDAVTARARATRPNPED